MLDGMMLAARKIASQDAFIERYQEVPRSTKKGFKTHFAESFASAYP